MAVGNGGKEQKKADELSSAGYDASDSHASLIRRDDANVQAVPLDRREYEIPLADGDLLSFRADAFGIVEAFDLHCADGRTLRFSKIIETVVPPFHVSEGRA